MLATTFLSQLDGRVTVATGSCDPLSAPQPLGPLFDIAHDTGGPVMDLLLEDAPRYQIYRAFLTWLADQETTPVVVFENIHWADEATLDLLRFLSRRIEPTGALLIATFRSDEIHPDHRLQPLLGELATSTAQVRITVDTLSIDAVRQLAAGSAFDAEALHNRTNGNPFYVTEVLATDGGEVPATIRDAVLARVSRLSPGARNTLEAAAVIGFRIEPWLLTRVAEPDTTMMTECLASGVLVQNDREFSFRHEIGRETIYNEINLQRRGELHQRTLNVLIGADDQANMARLAFHAEAADDQRQVIEYAVAAARQARSLGANAEAAAQYERVFRFGEHLPLEYRAVLLGEYGVACDETGRADESIAALEQAVEIWEQLGDRRRQGEVLSRLSVSLCHAERPVRAERANDEAIELLEAIEPGSELAVAYANAAAQVAEMDDAEAALTLAEQSLELAEQFGVVEAESRSLNVIGFLALRAGDVEGGQTHLEKAAAIASEHNLTHAAAIALTNLSDALGVLYETDLAGHYIKQMTAYVREYDIDYLYECARGYQSQLSLFKGDWSGVEQTTVEILNRSEDILTRTFSLEILGRLKARLGQKDTAGLLDEALELALRSRQLQRIGPVRTARAEAAWLAGEPERTAHEARAAYDLAVSKEDHLYIGEMAYWRWKAGDLSVAPALGMKQFTLQIEGDWQGAARVWERLGCPYESARALAEGDDTDALLQALDTFQGLGAEPMATEVSRKLRSMGIQPHKIGPKAATRTNPANLTPRELEVAELLAQNLTNSAIADRLFISPRTVSYHVSNVLGKLNVSRRYEVGAALARRQPASSLASDG